MWMTAYISDVQRQFVELYEFTPRPDAPLIPAHVPDGEYPMTIDGKVDRVKVVNGFINCCNVDESSGAIAKRQCWHCHNPAVEVWHTTWDEQGQDWPMCGRHVRYVRQALAHRAAGCDTEADAIDEQSGISTDGNGGQWIPPTLTEVG